VDNLDLLVRLDAIDDRLTTIERTLTRLGGRIGAQGGMLVGWAAIEAATGKKRRTLRRYMRFGLPVYRWGWRVTSSVQLISSWLTTVELGRIDGSIPRWRPGPTSQAIDRGPARPSPR